MKLVLIVHYYTSCIVLSFFTILLLIVIYLLSLLLLMEYIDHYQDKKNIIYRILLSIQMKDIARIYI